MKILCGNWGWHRPHCNGSGSRDSMIRGTNLTPSGGAINPIARRAQKKGNRHGQMPVPQYRRRSLFHLINRRHVGGISTLKGDFFSDYGRGGGPSFQLSVNQRDTTSRRDSRIKKGNSPPRRAPFYRRRSWQLCLPPFYRRRALPISTAIGIFFRSRARSRPGAPADSRHIGSVSAKGGRRERHAGLCGPVAACYIERRRCCARSSIG